MKTGWKSIIFGLVLALPGAYAAESLPERYSAYGELVLSRLRTAPFPHPTRAEGHRYQDKFFSAAQSYSNSTVAIFIPRAFKRAESNDFIVHFHGWGGNITNVLSLYKVIEQFEASGKNAILIVPQGPFEASDSFGGKLEDPDGF